MPALRYGRDISDDAAQLLRLRDEAVAQIRDTALAPDVRDRARERLKDINELVRNAYGNIRTVKLFASQAVPYEGTYDSPGRRAAGLNSEVSTRPALNKAAQAALRRLQAQGRIPRITIYDENEKDSPVNIGRARPTSLTPRMQAGRERNQRAGVDDLMREAATPSPRGQPRVLPYRDILTAGSAQQAARITEKRRRDAEKKAAKRAAAPKPAKKAAAPKKAAKKAARPRKKAQ